MPKPVKTKTPLKKTSRNPPSTKKSAGEEKGNPTKGSRGSRVAGHLKTDPLIVRIANYIGKYIALPETQRYVIASWIAAAWLAECWDRFPHLAITSPEKRCGKSWLLEIIEQITPEAKNAASITPAALTRVIAATQPTLLMDEAQSLSRRGSEADEKLREILNAGISRNACITKCSGDNNEPKDFSIYCPKVVALIGELDGVLADRCLNIRLERKTENDTVARCQSRTIAADGKPIHDSLEKWAQTKKKKIERVYTELEPVNISNDRLAELLLPLQSVMTVDYPNGLNALQEYAEGLDAAENDRVSDGVMLLAALKDIFGDKDFMGTSNLLVALEKRTEEPWYRYNRGKTISAEQLARILKEFGIKPDRKQKKHNGKNETIRGYQKGSFEDTWKRYLPSVSK